MRYIHYTIGGALAAFPAASETHQSPRGPCDAGRWLADAQDDLAELGGLVHAA
jgi:hypothetical protein